MTHPQLPSIAVGIPTYQREQVLVDTIEQLLSLLHPADEIIVADQTPEHEMHVEAYLSQKHAANQIRWLRLEKPSLCAARNQILANTTCDVVLYLDDDVIIAPNLVEYHRCAYLDPLVDLIGGQVYSRNKGVTHVSPDDPCAGTHPIREAVSRIEDAFFIGCHYSVRRSSAIAVGGFDEQIAGSAYWEEGDFAARIANAGFHVFFDPHIWVTHLQSPSGGCRIPGNYSHPQWTKTMNYFLYRFRYGRKGKATWARTLKESLRSGPLLRENFLRPWRWHYYWANYFYSIFEGYKRAKSPIQSPFVKN